MLWIGKMLLILAMTVVFKKSPMVMIMVMIMASIATAIILMQTTMTPWVSLLLIMIYVSGIMVIFMYAASLNQKFKNSSKESKNTMAIFTIILALYAMSLTTSNNLRSHDLKFNELYSSMHYLIMIMLLMVAIMASAIHLVVMAKEKGMKSSK